jgi:hypothetical protein
MGQDERDGSLGERKEKEREKGRAGAKNAMHNR